jgi:hypothetical protein
VLVSLGRRQEADAGMAAPAVVEDLQMLEQRLPRRRLGREGGAVDELVLQAAEEALHRRAVVAVAAPAHRAAQAMAGQELRLLATGMLHASDALLFVKRRSALG